MAALAVATLAMVSCNPEPVNPPEQKPEVKAPTAEDLADYVEDGKYVVCVSFEETVCNDIVYAGSYNGWVENPAEMLTFEALEGFEGWYVVAVPSLTNEDGTLNNAGKPVQLKEDGSFSWDFQTGDKDSWTVLAGTVDIEPGYGGEANLSNYDPANGPIILQSAYFKEHNSPCVEAVEHNYTVILFAPDCGGFEPAIIGDFNGWSAGVAMELQLDGSYKYSFTDVEGHAFKFKASTDTDWSNQLQHLVLNEETGENEWQDLGNEKLAAEETITFTYNTEEYKYTLCE